MNQPKLTKKYISDLVILNFYRYKVYEIRDAKGKILYNAEPASVTGAYGVTRTGNTIDEVKLQLIDDCKFLNWLNMRDYRRARGL